MLALPSRALFAARQRGRRRYLAALGRQLALALEWAARRSNSHVGAAIVYHSVGDPAGDPRHQLVPPMASALFEAQMRYLASRYRLVAASDLLPAIRSRSRGEAFPIAITFDDDLSSHADVAAPILLAAGVTATFFVSGASLDAPFRFWWERLQVAVDRKLDLDRLALPDELRRTDIHTLGRWMQARPPKCRMELEVQLAALVGDDPAGAGLPRDLLAALAHGGLEVGFHTRRHHLLPGLDDEELAEAIREGRDEIGHVAGRPLMTISYPHGEADARVARAAQAAGYVAGFTGRPTSITPNSDPLLLGRLSPSYTSVGELAFDVAVALFRAATQR